MLDFTDLPSLRLRSLGLTSAPLERPDDVVRRLVAVQAQDYYGAIWSLAQRMGDARDTEIDAAFDRGEILRTHLLRPTWHFVLPEDIRTLLALTAPRVHQINGTMARKSGLEEKTFLRADAAIAAALEGGRFSTRDELRIAIEAAGIDAGDNLRLTYLVMHAELEGIICSGPRRGKQFTYALLDERAPAVQVLDREAALSGLARRYFESRGPATAEDFAKWSGLTLTEARAGLGAVQADFETVDLNGRAYWFPPGIPAAVPNPPRALLLSIYDEYSSSYKDHGASTSPAVIEHLMNLGSALYYMVVVDGRVIGTWRRIIKKKEVAVEVTLLETTVPDAKASIRAAAGRYARFLGLTLRLEP